MSEARYSENRTRYSPTAEADPESACHFKWSELQLQLIGPAEIRRLRAPCGTVLIENRQDHVGTQSHNHGWVNREVGPSGFHGFNAWHGGRIETLPRNIYKPKVWIRGNHANESSGRKTAEGDHD
jgi:hypothetical protein